jgi:hypothetical protein
MLAGPIRLLGRFSGVQALLGQPSLSLADFGDAGEVIDASRHVGVLRSRQGGIDSYGMIGISDAMLLRAVSSLAE